MLRSRLSSSLGFLILLVVLFIAVLERGQEEITYFNWHAAVVVIGGVLGSLLMALDGHVFVQIFRDWFGVIFGRDALRSSLAEFKTAMTAMNESWSKGRRGEVLDLVEKGECEEIRVAAQALVQHLRGARLEERFEYLRSTCQSTLVPQVEAWDMVARLAPSFGIVGTVAGMVQMFRNMANSAGNLGAPMALALLATLYGILMGTALGGPMATRLNQILSERLAMIDLLERQVAAMVEES